MQDKSFLTERQWNKKGYKIKTNQYENYLDKKANDHFGRKYKYYSSEQVEKMSDEQIAEYLENARALRRKKKIIYNTMRLHIIYI